jgi:hypothetical protein
MSLRNTTVSNPQMYVSPPSPRYRTWGSALRNTLVIRQLLVRWGADLCMTVPAELHQHRRTRAPQPTPSIPQKQRKLQEGVFETRKRSQTFLESAFILFLTSVIRTQPTFGFSKSFHLLPSDFMIPKPASTSNQGPTGPTDYFQAGSGPPESQRCTTGDAFACRETRFDSKGPMPPSNEMSIHYSSQSPLQRARCFAVHVYRVPPRHLKTACSLSGE